MKIKWATAPTMIRWNKLKALRKEKGFTQPQLAVGAGLSIATICNLELGYEDRTTEETKQKLAKFFDCGVDDLFPVDMIGDVPREEFFKSLQSKKAK